MHQSPFTETIFALSSGRLPSGVAVVRISGTGVKTFLEQCCGGVPAPRQMTLRDIRSEQGNLIDRGLICYFPGPSSFTGEDCAEIHLHGGKAVVAATLSALGGYSGFRHAEAGEFTRRAFLNGKIDLTGAEALSDLISAETEAQRRLAAENASGSQHQLYSGWREKLIRCRALIEAELDFSDEEDVPGSVADQVWFDVGSLKEEIERHIAGYKCAEIIRAGYRVAIIGAPNTGKSSLLNALAKRDVAIVTDEPGTTRDVISVTLDLDGYAVTVSDTAGIREAEGKVEAIGIEKAVEEARRADLVLHLTSPDTGNLVDNEVVVDRELEEADCLKVMSKNDLPFDGPFDDFDISISSKTGEGIDELLSLILMKVSNAVGVVGDVLPSRLRHVQELESARRYLDEACGNTHDPLEIRAEALRLGSTSLARIIGAIDVDDLLDVVFRSFCIGK